MNSLTKSTDATLTEPENERLIRLEQTICRGMRQFVQVGQALIEIRDDRLYRETDSSFEKYIRRRWCWSAAHAYRLIKAASRAKPPVVNMGENCHPNETDLPQVNNERQSRELDKVSEEHQQEVLNAAHQERLSARAIAAAERGRVAEQLVPMVGKLRQRVDRFIQTDGEEGMIEMPAWILRCLLETFDEATKRAGMV